MNKKALILAGKPIGTLDIIEYLQDKGIYTVVTDNLTVEQSKGKELANEYWGISTADLDELEKKCVKEKIAAVFTGVHEFNISKAQELCERLSLPFYATKTQIEQTSNKTFYKQLFRNYDVPVPVEYDSQKPEDMSKLSYPVLVKPSDGSGARGVAICKNEEEFKENYQLALEISKNKRVLVEEYVVGEEVTIFYLLLDGEMYLTAMADRHMGSSGEDQIPLPVLYTFPSKYLSHFQDELNSKVKRAIQSLGLKTGMVFIQAFINESGFKLYDIGYRLTGTQEYHLLEKVCGYNPLKIMVDYSLGEKANQQLIKEKINPSFNNQHAFNITFLAKPSLISRFVGLDEVAKMDGVVKVIKNHLEGTIIPNSASGTLNQVVLRVLGVSQTKELMLQLVKDIRECIDVLDERGESVLVPLDTKDKEI